MSAGDDVRVTAFESDTMIVVAGGVGVSTGGTAAGAAIAYNFIGGSFDDANPDLIDKDSTATDQITAYIDNAKVTAGGDVEVRAGYEPPTTPLRTSVNVWTETVVTSERVEFVDDPTAGELRLHRAARLAATGAAPRSRPARRSPSPARARTTART